MNFEIDAWNDSKWHGPLEDERYPTHALNTAAPDPKFNCFAL